MILFSGVQGAPLYRVAAIGGALFPATSTEATGGGKHDYPDFLPDDRHFLFTAREQLFLGSVDAKEARALPGLAPYAAFAPDHEKDRVTCSSAVTAL